MDERFHRLKAVGFDLDQTLYQDSSDVHKVIRNEIYCLIANEQSISLAKAKEQFEDAYGLTGSGGKALARCGISDPREALRDCLDRADVSSMLQPDERLVGLLGRLSMRYRIFMITDSRKENGEKKISALGINSELFNPRIYWDNDPAHPGAVNKDDGTAFTYVQKILGMFSQELVYVGNSEKNDIIPPSQDGWRTIHLSKNPSTVATAHIKEIYELEKLLL